MLILLRRVGESIHIGEAIVLTVIRTDRGKVQIGIEAPREVPVHRAEIYKRIQDALVADIDGNIAEPPA